jgi:hypothetical protein
MLIVEAKVKMSLTRHKGIWESAYSAILFNLDVI